jgi:hypothetical protein
VLAVVFLKGFNEAIGLATAAALPYLALNLIVLGGVPGRSSRSQHSSITGIRACCERRVHAADRGALLVFPSWPRLERLRNWSCSHAADRWRRKGSQAARAGVTAGSYRDNTKLLLVAAVIMSVLLILSSPGYHFAHRSSGIPRRGKASGRAHRVPGAPIPRPGFGTGLDVSTILDSRLAGASAMAALLTYSTLSAALRNGAALGGSVAPTCPCPVRHRRHHHSDLRRLGRRPRAAAYATGVLVLDSIGRLRRDIGAVARGAAGGCSCTWGCSVWCLASRGGQLSGRPDGLVIGIILTLLLMLTCAVSRSLRSVEFRIPTRLLCRCRELAHRARAERQKGPSGSD